MEKEFRIGGEFDLTWEHYLSKPTSQEPLPYANNDHFLFVDTGRSALLLALLRIRSLGGKAEAWLPVYCCESVILPFRQLGFELYFYSMGEDLQSPNYLPEKLDGQTFLFINYFGIKNEGIINWLSNISESDSCFIIEDNVQAGFSNNVGSTGDFVIYSYRKVLPQPDGAVLAYCGEPASFLLEGPSEEFISSKVMGKLIRAANGDAHSFLPLLNEAESIIDDKIIPRQMSAFSRYLFNRSNFKGIKETRRANWLYMKDLLEQECGKMGSISQLFDKLSEDEVPLGFPVQIHRDRDELRNYLITQNVFCPIHWPIADERIELEVGKADNKLSSTLLTIPIDQRVSKRDIEYCVDRLAQFLRRSI